MLLRTVSWVFAGFMVSGLASANQSFETSFSGNYLAGRTAGRLRDSESAAIFLNAALKQESGNPILIERLFQAELGKGNVEQAEKLAPEVITNNSQQRMARIVLGLKEFRNRRYPEARVQFAEAAYTPVGELTSTLLNAWSYAGEGSLDAALKELNKLDGQDAFAGYKAVHTAMIADFLNSTMRADSAYKKAYQLTGNSLRVVQAYANFLQRNNRNDVAEKVYQKFLEGGQRAALIETSLAELKSGNKPSAFIATPTQGVAEVLFSLAAAMNGDQSADAALMYAQLALAFKPDEAVMRSMVGDVYSDMKSSQSAIAAYDQVPATSPLRSYADTQIALNLQSDDKPKEAIEKLLSVVEKDTKNIEALINLGGLYRIGKELEKAADVYSQIITLQGDDKSQWRIFYYRGICFDQLKNYEKSEADFRKALSLSKDEPSVLNYLGYSMIDRGVKLDEAIAW